jgi:hypothetical protein
VVAMTRQHKLRRGHLLRFLTPRDRWRSRSVLKLYSGALSSLSACGRWGVPPAVRLLLRLPHLI